MVFKSIRWWENELNNVLDYFDTIGNPNNICNERIKEKNKIACNTLIRRGNLEIEFLSNIEREIKNIKDAKKKKKE